MPPSNEISVGSHIFPNPGYATETGFKLGNSKIFANERKQ